MSDRIRQLRYSARVFLYRYAPRWVWLHRAAQAYADFFAGDNGYVITLNGESHLIERVLKGLDAPVVIDVGAHVGEWSVVAVAANPSLRLHCFEPVSATFAQLQARGLPASAVLNQVGISDSVGSATFYIHPDNWMNAAYEMPFQPVIAKETIPVTTLADYAEAHGLTWIEVIKIDAEGSDYDAIAGALPLLRAGKVGIIQFEYTTTWLYVKRSLGDLFTLIAETPISFTRSSRVGSSPYRRTAQHSTPTSKRITCSSIPMWRGVWRITPAAADAHS